MQEQHVATLVVAVSGWGPRPVVRASDGAQDDVSFVCYRLGMTSSATEKHPKGDPFSVRFTASTDRVVQEEARRTRRSKSAVVEALTEEAMRTRRFPGVGFRGDDAGRRPWLIGSGLDVWEAIEMLEDYDSPERLVEETQLTDRQVRLALAYRKSYPEEIAEAIAQNRRTAREWRDLYPFVEFSADS